MLVFVHLFHIFFSNDNTSVVGTFFSFHILKICDYWKEKYVKIDISEQMP